MIYAFKYVYYVSCIIITLSGIFGQSYNYNSSKYIRTTNTILNKKSWCKNCNDINDNLAQQTLFIDGALIKFSDVLTNPLTFEEDTMLKITNMMYLSLGCKSAKTIKDIMSSLIDRLQETNDFNEKMTTIKRDLTSVNIVILKTISILIDLTDIEVNLLSHESGILKTTILLNLNVNNLIELLYDKNLSADEQKSFVDSCDRMIHQMINIIERFTFSNCLFDYKKTKKTNETSNSQPQTSTEEPSSEQKTHNLIRYFDKLLNNTGLSASFYMKYNINSYLIVADLSKNDSSNEINILIEDKKSSDDDPLKNELSFPNSIDFNIVHHVLTELGSILNNKVLLDQPLSLGTKLDIEYIFSTQKLIVDLIMSIIYQNIKSILIKLKNEFDEATKPPPKASSKSKPKPKSTSNVVVSNVSENRIKYFLGKSEIKDTKLIITYERLMEQAKQLKFPLDFINSIGLIVRVLKDLQNRYKNIQGLDIIIKYIDENILILSKSKNILLVKDLSSLLKNYMSLNNNKFELHTFLKGIVSIQYIKHFNQIYEILRNDIDENDERLLNNMIFLNKINFITDIESNKEKCDLIIPLYALCFDMQSKQPSKENLKSVFHLIDEKSSKLPNKDNSITLINYAYDYVSYNLIFYPNEGNLNEKFIRILYHITNLLDKYQIHSCSSPNYRDTLYNEFINNPEKQSSHLSNTNSNYFPEKDLRSKFRNISFKELTEQFNTPLFLKLIWKGEEKTMENIYVYMTENMFDIFSLPKYIILIFKFTSLVIYYKILDVSYFSIKEKAGSSDKTLLINAFKTFPSIDFRCSEISAVVNTLGSFVPEYTLPVVSLEMELLLDDNFEKFNFDFTPYTRSNNLSSHVKKLEKMVKNVKVLLPKI